jgi:beta-phosphoglucomutase-like phosphatase (HAD superfamily)
VPKFQGAIVDVDAVLADSPHEKAWRESLRELMESSWRDIRDQTTWSLDAFTPHVYQQYVSGKPRTAGARAALDHFGVEPRYAMVIQDPSSGMQAAKARLGAWLYSLG